jgi:hypothetical protein
MYVVHNIHDSVEVLPNKPLKRMVGRGRPPTA